MATRTPEEYRALAGRDDISLRHADEAVAYLLHVRNYPTTASTLATRRREGGEVCLRFHRLGRTPCSTPRDLDAFHAGLVAKSVRLTAEETVERTARVA